MSNEKQLTPIMEAIRDQKSTLKNTREHIRMIDLSNMNQSDQNKIDQAICIQYAISVLESLLPKEEESHVEAFKAGIKEEDARQRLGFPPTLPTEWFNETFKTESDE